MFDPIWVFLKRRLNEENDGKTPLGRSAGFWGADFFLRTRHHSWELHAVQHTGAVRTA